MTIKRYKLAVKYSEVLQYQATKHLSERLYRLQLTVSDDEIVSAFYVDKGHINGPEVHYLTKQARVLIVNEYTHRLITILNARPGQISRYYTSCHELSPKYLLHKASDNKKMEINLQ